MDVIKSFQAHLAGREPLTGIQFNDQYMLNHAYWEMSEEDEFDLPFTVRSDPYDDVRRLDHVTKGRAEESLRKLDFILTDSDGRELLDVANPITFLLPSHLGLDAPNSRREQVNYNVHLRVIERLCRDGRLWIAINPDTSYCCTFKGQVHTRQPLGAPNIAGVEEVSSDRIALTLEGKSSAFKPTANCATHLFVYDNVGITIDERTWRIDPKKPFVAVSISEENLHSVTALDAPLVIANTAFLRLLESEPDLAEALYREAVLDIHTPRDLRDERGEWDVSTFMESADTSLRYLVNPAAEQGHCLGELLLSTEESVRTALRGLDPRLCAALSPNSAGVSIEILDFRVQEGAVSIRANVELSHLVYQVTVAEGITHINEVHHARI